MCEPRLRPGGGGLIVLGALRPLQQADDCMATVEDFRGCLNKDIVGRESLKEKLIEQSRGLRIVLLLLPKYRLGDLPALVDIVFASKSGSLEARQSGHVTHRTLQSPLSP